MTKFFDAVYSFERVGGYQFVKLYISMFEKWLESPQWLLAVSKPEVRMRVTSAWGQELCRLLQCLIVKRVWLFTQWEKGAGCSFICCNRYSVKQVFYYWLIEIGKRQRAVQIKKKVLNPLISMVYRDMVSSVLVLTLASFLSGLYRLRFLE